MMSLHWLETDHRFIAAHQQPGLLIDIAQSRGIDLNRLFAHTGIFYEDVLRGDLNISTDQFLRLIRNSQKLLKGDDISFLFGHRLFPGNYGPVTEAILQSENLLKALEVICNYKQVASPMLNLQMHLDEDHCHLNLFDCSGAGPQMIFLLEATAAAISQMGRWLTGQNLPWRFCFSHPEPKYIEQYEVHLAGEYTFSSQVDSLMLPKEYLLQPLSRGSSTGYAVSLQQCESLYSATPEPFLTCIYEYLYAEVKSSPSLIRTADYFGMSPATFKRKLKKHRVNFQEIQDCVRKQVAVYLFTYCNYTNEQVAAYLNFADVNNFRRSFKRWTGLTPSLFKQS